MTTFNVIAAQEARRLPQKDDFPEAAVDHLTLSANGSQVLVTMFRKVTEPLPDVGSTVDVELGEQDRFDKDRRKAKRVRSGGGGGFRKRDPAESHRIERQHSQEMALRYIAIKVATGKVGDFTMAEVTKLTAAFQRDLDPTPAPTSDIPGDTGGLPPLDDVPNDDGSAPF